MIQKMVATMNPITYNNDNATTNSTINKPRGGTITSDDDNQLLDKDTLPPKYQSQQQSHKLTSTPYKTPKVKHMYHCSRCYRKFEFRANQEEHFAVGE